MFKFGPWFSAIWLNSTVSITQPDFGCVARSPGAVNLRWCHLLQMFFSRCSVVSITGPGELEGSRGILDSSHCQASSEAFRSMSCMSGNSAETSSSHFGGDELSASQRGEGCPKAKQPEVAELVDYPSSPVSPLLHHCGDKAFRGPQIAREGLHWGHCHCSEKMTESLSHLARV